MIRRLWWMPALLLAAGLLAAGAGALTLTLKHKKPGDIAALVGPELSPDGALSVDNAAMTLVLREQPGRIDYFRKRILELDIPAQPFAMGVRLGALPVDALPAPGATAAPPAPTPIAGIERQMREGEGADLPLGEYRLRLALGLYDTRTRVLRLSELKLYPHAEPRARNLPILSMSARLKSGRPTVFAVDRAGGTLVLEITPRPVALPPETKPEPR